MAQSRKLVAASLRPKLPPVGSKEIPSSATRGGPDRSLAEILDLSSGSLRPYPGESAPRNAAIPRTEQPKWYRPAFRTYEPPEPELAEKLVLVTKEGNLLPTEEIAWTRNVRLLSYYSAVDPTGDTYG